MLHYKVKPGEKVVKVQNGIFELVETLGACLSLRVFERIFSFIKVGTLELQGFLRCLSGGLGNFGDNFRWKPENTFF